MGNRTFRRKLRPRHPQDRQEPQPHHPRDHREPRPLLPEKTPDNTILICCALLVFAIALVLLINGLRGSDASALYFLVSGALLLIGVLICLDVLLADEWLEGEIQQKGAMRGFPAWDLALLGGSSRYSYIVVRYRRLFLPRGVAARLSEGQVVRAAVAPIFGGVRQVWLL